MMNGEIYVSTDVETDGAAPSGSAAPGGES